ncbi:MAG: hypothetical protein ACLQSR_02805 [Limisphaerales bacterium]
MKVTFNWLRQYVDFDWPFIVALQPWIGNRSRPLSNSSLKGTW